MDVPHRVGRSIQRVQDTVSDHFGTEVAENCSKCCVMTAVVASFFILVVDAIRWII
jgi:hypothetical protein